MPAAIRAGVPALVLVASLTGCAVGAGSGGPDDPHASLTAAVAAMEEDDFGSATEHLAVAASQCSDPSVSRRATILLAAAELDTANPAGSAREAAMLARHYLSAPDTGPEERLLARALYRLATHLETLAPASGDEGVETRATPSHPCAVAEDADPDRSAPGVGPSEAPWLLGLDGSIRASRHRVVELETELRRIGALLTSGTEPPVEVPAR